MTVEIALAIVVAAGFCCYLVWKWQEAAVDIAPPPYQEPVKAECPLGHTAVDKTGETVVDITPTAAWPFPSSRKP